MEEPVLKRIARGEQRAVSECIEQFGNLVWALARRLSRTRADAEDAVQEIFIDLWRSAGRYDPAQGSEKVFITTIARRRLIDRLRRSAQEPARESTDALDAVGWAEPGTRGDLRGSRAGCSCRRTPATRAANSTRAGILQGLSHSEIAAKTGMALGTVKTNMRRGLIEVRELMETPGAESAGGSRS